MSAPRITTFEGDEAAPPPAALVSAPFSPRPPSAPSMRGRLGAERRREAWRLPLSTEQPFAAVRVLHGGGAVLVRSRSEWLLAGDDGKLRARGALSSSGAVVDGERGRFFVGAPHGDVTAHSLEDGGRRLEVSCYFDLSYDRLLLEVVGARLLVVSVERHIRGGPRPRTSVVELHAEDTASEMDRVADVVIDAAPILAARGGRTLVLSADGWLAFVSTESLRVERLFSAKLSPEALAVDDAGRAAIAAETREGRALWLVTAEGQRLVEHALEGRVVGPPLFGDDERLFVLGPRAVRAIDPRDEARSWTRPLVEAPAGATVSGDGWLVVAEGRQLRALDAEGVARLVHITSAPIVAPPLLLADDRLLLATATDLVCLVP